MKTMPKTILFDLDGTLLDSLNDLWASVNHSLAQNNMSVRSKEEIRQFLGNGARQLISLSMPPGYSDKEFSQVYNEFKTYYSLHSSDKTKPYDGIMPMLEQLKQLGVKTGIVSNKPDTAVQKLYRRFFSNSIDMAIGEQEGITRKPSPDMIFKALSILGSDVSQSIYVGDSEVDIATANNSGIKCISVSWGFRGRSYLENEGASTIVDDPTELINLLKDIHFC